RRGLAPGALVAQLLQRRIVRHVQQVVFGCGIDLGGVGDGRLLFGRELALAGGGVGLGVGAETLGVVELLLGLGDRLARLLGQHVCGALVAAVAPQLRLGDPRRGQGFDRGADVLHASRPFHDALGLRSRQQRRVEPRGKLRQRPLQLPELYAHSAPPSSDCRPRGSENYSNVTLLEHTFEINEIESSEANSLSASVARSPAMGLYESETARLSSSVGPRNRERERGCAIP